MYPVIVRRLAELKAGDKIVAHSGERYARPLRVIAPLGPLTYGAGRGVRVEDPAGAGEELVLYPWQMDGQVIEIDRAPSSLRGTQL